MLPKTHSTVALLCAMTLPGCTLAVGGSAGGTVVPPDGSLTADWSIEGANDPLVCSDFHADTMEITIFAQGDDIGTSVDAACDSFTITVPLPPGNYSATAVLLDGNGVPVTSEAAVPPFQATSRTDLGVSIDFGASSFL